MQWHKYFPALLVALLSLRPAFATDTESLLRLNIAAMTFHNEARTLGYPYADCRPYAHSNVFLSEGDSYLISTTLYQGYDYVILGAGDRGVKNLDVEIYDENRHLLNRDTDHDAMPMLKTHPNQSGRFYIRVKAREGSGYSNIMICHVPVK
jgi:hypothetical protein